MLEGFLYGFWIGGQAYIDESEEEE